MGKIRRQRNKYHLSNKSDSTHSVLNATTDWKESSQNDDLSFPPQAFENIFAGIDIPISNVKLDDDTQTVVSTSKSVFKDRSTKKKERRKLRHQTFIERINAIQALKKMKQTGKKKKKNNLKTNEESSIFDPGPSTSTAQAVGPRRPPMKKRGILKSGARHTQLMKNIAAYQKSWESLKFKADPIASVSELVQERIVKESE